MNSNAASAAGWQKTNSFVSAQLSGCPSFNQQTTSLQPTPEMVQLMNIPTNLSQPQSSFQSMSQQPMSQNTMSQQQMTHQPLSHQPSLAPIPDQNSSISNTTC